MPFVLNWKTVQIIKMLRIWVILSAAQSRVPANIVGIKLRFRVIIRCLPLALLLKAGRVKLYPNEVRQRDAKNGSRMSG